MKANERIFYILLTVTSIIFLLIFTSTIQLTLSPSASAYPAPDQSHTQNSYPINSPAINSVTPPPAPLIQVNITPVAIGYLPIVEKAFPTPFPTPETQTRFSVAGADFTWLGEVIPEPLQISSYSWSLKESEFIASRTIKMIRSCYYFRARAEVAEYENVLHYYYQDTNYAKEMICWDPTTNQIAKILPASFCPMNKPCLDIESDQISPSETGLNLFTEAVRSNPDWIWLIGNEPDRPDQDNILRDIYELDHLNQVRSLPVDGPVTYAYFFKTIYDTIANENVVPKLVFCQASATYFIEGADLGTNYCIQAYAELITLNVGNSSTKFNPSHIYALSNHHYVWPQIIGGVEYKDGELLSGRAINGQPILDYVTANWINDLQVFENWAIDAGMGDKPLWLTEYGHLSAWCYPNYDSHGGELEPGGVYCPPGDRKVFYGRNSNEGIWGLQKRQMAYLAGNHNQWQAAWWFVSQMGLKDGVCDQTAWLWQDDHNCTETGSRTRAGETHYELLCAIEGYNCPEINPTPRLVTVTPTPMPPITLTSTPTPTQTSTPTPPSFPLPIDPGPGGCYCPPGQYCPDIAICSEAK